MLTFLQTRPHSLYGVGIDAVPAQDAWGLGFPGFAGMDLDPGPGPGMNFDAIPSDAEPYFFHFPDGNATLARLMVRGADPRAIPGRNADDVVTARADYAQLDEAASPGAAAPQQHRGAGRAPGQAGRRAGGGRHLLRGGAAPLGPRPRVVMACWNTMIPYLCPDLPADQKDALAYAVKVPIVYTNVLLRNWTSFARLGTNQVYAPGSYHTSLNLDLPVSVGEYKSSRAPRRADRRAHGAHAVQPRPPRPRSSTGPAASSCCRPPSTTFERKIRDQLGRTLGAGGFDSARDIRAITVNRWPHGYAYQYNSLWDPFWLEGGHAAVRDRAPAVRPHLHRQCRRRRVLVRGRGHRPGPPRGDRGNGLSERPAFARVLGRADLLLFSVSAILTIDTLASAASMGLTWFGWWAITMVLFFVPYGLITAELGAAWPGEGGLYVWVREAMGPRWGSLAAWFYWINNAYWVPAVYMVFAGTFHSIFLRAHLPPNLQEGPGATWLQTFIALAVTWMTVGIGVVRLQVSKWVPNVGAVVKVAIFVVLGSLGMLSLLSGNPPANAFSWRGLVPDASASLRFLPVLVYNALGFELMSSAGEEMRDPQRDVPRVILLSGLVISVVYMLGVAGILISVPLSELSLLTGTWDALAALGKPWGAGGDALVLALGIGFLYACVANIVTWSLGVNRVAAAAAAEGALPAALGHLHPRYNTPAPRVHHHGDRQQRAAAGQRRDVVERRQRVLDDVQAVRVVLPDLVPDGLPGLCPAAAEAGRPAAALPDAGGLGVAWTAAIVCWLFIALACALFFKPSPDIDPAQARREMWLLAAETLVTLAVGLFLMPKRRAS